MSRSDRWLLFSLTALALLAGTAYPFAGWLPNRNLWFAPIAAISMAVAFIQGVRRSASNARLRRLAAGGCWAALVAIAFLAPVTVYRELLWRSVRSLPILPDADAIFRSVEIDDYRRLGRSVTGFRVDYRTEATIEEIETFYREQLAARGSQMTSTYEFPPAAFATMPAVTRQRRCVFTGNGCPIILDTSEYVFDGAKRREITVRGGHGLVREVHWW